MKNKELITIIIPVFNTSEYLVRCFDSIINQTYQNLEIIIIDDGSTDSSKKIILEYQKKDKRIKAIYTEHKGVASARNTGLNMAHGEYIGFVDSDDYIEPNMYETLLKYLKKYKADISMISFCKIKNNNIVEKVNTNKIYKLNKEEYIKEYLTLKRIKGHVTNKLYTKKIFATIRFPENMNYEDDAIFLSIVENIKSFVLYEKSLYYYCLRDNSITHTSNIKTRQDFYDITFNNYNIIQDKYPNLKAYATFYLIDSLISNYIYCANNNIKSITKQIEAQISLMMRLVQNYAEIIVKELDENKKVVLFSMLWNIDFTKKYILAI